MLVHTFRRNHPAASIYTVELYGILQALRHIESQVDNIYLICTLISSTQTLQDIFSFDPLIQIIHSMTHTLILSNKQIYIVWIPEHIGIRGNETADSAARFAATSDISKNSRYLVGLWTMKIKANLISSLM